MRRIVFISVVFFLAGSVYAFDEKPKTYVSILLDERKGGSYAWGVGTSPNSSLSVVFSTTDCMLRGGLNCTPTLFRQGALLWSLTRRVTAMERVREIRSWPPISRLTTSVR